MLSTNLVPLYHTNKEKHTSTQNFYYYVTNLCYYDRFCRYPEEATFSQIFDMCTENGWDVDLAIRASGIIDRKNNNEIVAVTKEDYIASLTYGN